MSQQERKKILGTLTVSQLRELAERYQVKGHSGLKRTQLVNLLAKSLDVDVEELRTLTEKLVEDKLAAKVRDGEDYFVTDQVVLGEVTDDAITAKVGGYRVAIHNLGEESFSYVCDEKCNDYVYQVRKGKHPFCKHYPAAIAQLIAEGRVDAREVRINHISGRALAVLLEAVERKRREEGAGPAEGRDLEGALQRIQRDLVRISYHDASLARQEYGDTPENVLERLVSDAFLLLEFETVPRTGPHGWDLLVLGQDAVPPYIAVVECKTSSRGIYDVDSDYLVRLKDYCIDLLMERLRGAYRDCVQYMLVVGPTFTESSAEMCLKFARIAGGIKLSLWPAETLRYLVERFRQNPIVTDDCCRFLFDKQKAIDTEDVDDCFAETERRIKILGEAARERLKEAFYRRASVMADSAFLNLDSTTMWSMLDEILATLEPDLVVRGGKTAMGVEMVRLKHDYFEIWRQVLESMVSEFVALLREQSETQEKRSEFKSHLLQFLGAP